MLTIPGLGEISAATILAEYGDINNFSSPNKMLAFAGLEPSIIQSGTIETMVRWLNMVLVILDIQL